MLTRTGAQRKVSQSGGDTSRQRGAPDGKDAKFGGDGYASFRRRAEDSDRADREAWGKPFRAAYASMLALPRVVNANDTKTAGQILERVEAALARGHWTRGEWARLTRMRGVWGSRAGGRDITFKLKGWRAKGNMGDTTKVRGWAAIRKELANHG